MGGVAGTQKSTGCDFWIGESVQGEMGAFVQRTTLLLTFYWVFNSRDDGDGGLEIDGTHCIKY